MTTTQRTSSEGSTGPTTKASFDLEPNPFEQSFASKESTVDPHKQPALNGAQPSPQLLTPGGRKLPLPILSPNAHSGWNSTHFARTGLTPNESGLRSGLTPNDSGPSMGSFPHSFQNLNIPGLNTPGVNISAFTSGFTPGLTSILSATAKEFENLQQNQPPPDIQMSNEKLPLSVQEKNTKEVDNFNTVVTQTKPNKLEDVKPKSNIKRGRKKKDEIEIDKDSKRLKTSSSTSSSSVPDVDTSRLKITSNNNSSVSITGNNQDSNKKSDIPGNDPENEETEEEKRKSFLERNRVAASKCRQRKKQQIVKMETDLNFYLNEYNNLTHTIDQLKEHSIMIRNVLMGKDPNQLVDSNETQKREMIIMNGINTILNSIEQTNYMSRLRGNNPSNIIPTVQPINPNLVVAPQQQQQQQQQQQAVATAQIHQLTAQTNMAQLQQLPMVQPTIAQHIQFNPMAAVSNTSLNSADQQQQQSSNSRDLSTTPVVILSSVPNMPNQVVHLSTGSIGNTPNHPQMVLSNTLQPSQQLPATLKMDNSQLDNLAQVTGNPGFI